MEIRRVNPPHTNQSLELNASGGVKNGPKESIMKEQQKITDKETVPTGEQRVRREKRE